MSRQVTTLFIGDFPHQIIEEADFIVPLFVSTDEIRNKNTQAISYLRKAEAIVSRSGCLFEKTLLSKAPKLRLLIKAGAGLDMVDHEYCAKRKIQVRNVPGANKEAVSELAIGLAITLARSIVEADTSMRQGIWKKNSLIGTELYGSAVSVIGYGNIGKRTAELLRAFNCKVSVYDPTLSKEEIDSALRQGIHVEDCINCTVKRANFIFLHPSLSETSRYLFNDVLFGKMKKKPFLINLSRAPVIQEQSLIKAFKEDSISGAAIDAWWEEPVTNNNLLKYNVIMTPHIGGNTKESLERVTDGSIRVIEELFETTK